MLASLRILLLTLLSAAAVAGSLTVSWTPPTQNTDGSAIPATGTGALASTRVEWGTCSFGSFSTKLGETVVSMPSTSTTVLNLTDGQLYCFRAYARNTSGVESAASAVASKTVPVPVPPTPQPPTLVTIATVAYEVAPNGTRLGKSVGSVPLGTACGARFITGYYEVPRSSVTLYRTPRSSLVVARCAQV